MSLDFAGNVQQLVEIAGDRFNGVLPAGRRKNL